MEPEKPVKRTPAEQEFYVQEDLMEVAKTVGVQRLAIATEAQ